MEFLIALAVLAFMGYIGLLVACKIEGYIDRWLEEGVD